MKKNISKRMGVLIIILAILLLALSIFISLRHINSLEKENIILKDQLGKINLELQGKDDNFSKIDFIKTDLEEEVMEQENKIDLLERNGYLLTQYDFTETKLIQEIKNPYNSDKNIYIYANNNASHLNSISEVKSCGWRYDDAYGCHVFLGNDEYKKLILSNTGFSPGKFINENTIEYYNNFSDGGASAQNTYKLNILDGSYERTGTGTGNKNDEIDTWYSTGVLDEFVKCDIRDLDIKKDDFSDCLHY